MDNRRARGEATRKALMRAAEQLIADAGIENVSMRDIVTAAGQKNESALQYHFKNLQGLINAIHASRDRETQAKRAALLQVLSEQTSNPSLRDICKLMVAPAFLLARSKPDFRRYIRAFGHEITLTEKSAVAFVNRKGGEGAREIGEILRSALRHLDEAAYQRRLDGALRFIAASMVHQAYQKNAFRGAQADLFFSSLLDALVGLLSAPQSEETKAIISSMQHS
jgi:AcrR family transcriptional regulator